MTLWNAGTLAPAGELRGMHSASQALAFSPDGTLPAAAEGNFEQPAPMRVWDVERKSPTAFRARAGAAALGFSPDGRLIAVAAIDHGTDVFDARTGRLAKHLRIGEFSGAGDSRAPWRLRPTARFSSWANTTAGGSHRRRPGAAVEVSGAWRRRVGFLRM